MINSKEVVKVAGLHPKLKLLRKNDAGVPTPTGPHIVKLLLDKEITKKDPQTGQDTQYIRYLVEENGERKTYDTRKFNKDTNEVSYLVLELSEYVEGSIVKLEGKKIGTKNYIKVTPVNVAKEVEVDEDDDE